MMTKLFCERCHKDTDCRVITVCMNSSSNGIYFSYQKQVAFCPKCSSFVNSPILTGKNIQSFEHAYKDAYRLANGIIPLEDIKAAVENIHINVYTLSKALGFSHCDLFNYYNDIKIPTKEHSDILEKLKDDTDFITTLKIKMKLSV